MRREFIQCRSLGHSWDWIPNVSTPSFGAYIWFRCERCSMIRKDIIAAHSGQLLARHYEQPVGYRVPKDERPDAAQLRTWLYADYNKKKKVTKRVNNVRDIRSS